MSIVPVLLLTHDDSLWNHWCKIDNSSWAPARGKDLNDLERWQDQGRKLVIMDLGLKGLKGIAGLPSLGNKMQTMQIIVATMNTDDTEGKEVISTGASGYVHAYMPTQAINTVLQSVNSGSVWMGPTLLARLLRDLGNKLPIRVRDWSTGLTDREKEVAKRAAMGHSNQAIADALNISERTVRAHMGAVFEKLGVKDRLQLALKVHGIN